MQYRNLNLDKLQAFAPERKLIDKENIYNAFLGLGDALQKGADAYTLNKIYQLSPDEQQRKMAEYRAYKGDFSGFDNIEQAKLRQAEMNALKEQQRIDKEKEEETRKRENFKTIHELKVDNARIIGLLRQGKRENPDGYIQRLDLDVYAREYAPELFALLENNNYKLKELGGNVIPLTPQIYKKGVEVSVPEIKTSGNSVIGSNDSNQVLDQDGLKNLDLSSRVNRDEVFKSDLNYIDILGDDKVKKLHYYINEQLKPKGKYILDTDLEKVLNKYPNEHLKKYIEDNYKVETQQDRNNRISEAKKKEKLKETEKKVADAIKDNTDLFGRCSEDYTNKQVIDWAKKTKDLEAQDKLNEIFNNYGYKR